MSSDWWGMPAGVLDQTPQINQPNLSPSIGDYLSSFQDQNKAWRESFSPKVNAPYRPAARDNTIVDPIVNDEVPKSAYWPRSDSDSDGGSNTPPDPYSGSLPFGDPLADFSLDITANDMNSLGRHAAQSALTSMGVPGLGLISTLGIDQMSGVPSTVTGFNMAGSLFGGLLGGLPGMALGGYLGRNFGETMDFGNQFGVTPSFTDGLLGALGMVSARDIAGRSLGLSGFGNEDSFGAIGDPYGFAGEDDIGDIDNGGAPSNSSVDNDPTGGLGPGGMGGSYGGNSGGPSGGGHGGSDSAGMGDSDGSPSGTW